MIDLRRDTITLPTEEMKRAAFAAKLGDSVYGEDETQRELEKRAAHLLGKDGALYVPSGTMGNLVAVLAQTQRGEEIVVEEHAHLRTSETGGAAAVGGIMIRTVTAVDGVPSAGQLTGAIREDNIHYPKTSLVCVEVPHYRYGGVVCPLDVLDALHTEANGYGLRVHMDGARLFNAAVHLGVEVERISRRADSVMVSLSKGLSAPVGALVSGSTEFIRRAERYRKMLGGGMRQTGWLCACGLEALSEANIALLAVDHANARTFALELATIAGLCVDVDRVHTNFVLADLEHPSLRAVSILECLKARGVLATAAGPKALRFVVCREVTRADVLHAAEVIRNVVAGLI